MDVNVQDLLNDGSPITNSDPTDMGCIRGSWTLANLLQETICSPRSLGLAICTTAKHKSTLLADFHAVYQSFPDVFRNYFHNLMLVHDSEIPDVPASIRGTLEGAHDAITTFFLLFAHLEIEARGWWEFNHRAFLEALCIGNVLKQAARKLASADMMAKDPVLVRAKGDISNRRRFPNQSEQEYNFDGFLAGARREMNFRQRNLHGRMKGSQNTHRKSCSSRVSVRAQNVQDSSLLPSPCDSQVDIPRPWNQLHSASFDDKIIYTENCQVSPSKSTKFGIANARLEFGLITLRSRSVRPLQ
ncbi:hypothetical protein FOXB_00152 [Fusarium oxysporum f. sp. conglutinans Fo5176]|uniref:Uncharacterized protein n=1 Tax=Fusarium oxysporum (strain Fo5176) TaxID=660025 RepID=F9F178_FUSOF|nr:hypothetical protein FOXB_00152 [Fusarium oxysporum f. sp. conglutinans Fo5176]